MKNKSPKFQMAESQFTHINLITVYLATFIIFSLLIISAEANNDHSVPQSESRMRVLLVKNLDKQDSLERAASLSLDLPNYEPTKDQEIQPQQQHQQQNEQTSSSGYHQKSIASLTLNQQEATSRSDSQQKLAGTTPNPWTEIHLPKLKPSWLNVSSRFKITGASIEEEAFVYPLEFLIRSAFDSPILLKTKLGILEGVRSIKFNKHLYTFLGVPYAKAPVGELRFKAPQEIDKWEGVFQATKWPPFCVQPSMTLASKSSPIHILTSMMSEDCLYLNVWTPSLKFNANRKRPVMVWLHGGAFQYGGASVDENDGSALALAGDVVVVTLNYRVSAFGFLNANNPSNGPNNVGILDQRKAMEWVQANIKQFGGDPQQVTLFGESAGGHSVGLHMISPGSHPLFKRAILQSGVPISFLRSYDVNPDNKDSPVGEGVSSVMMAKRLRCYVPDEETTKADSLESPELTTASTITRANVSSDENINSTEATPIAVESEAIGDMDVPILNDITLSCMRNKSSLEILKAMGVPGSAGFFPTGNDPKGVFPNGPIMDSFDPENPKIGPQKDYLLGTNTDEGTFMLHYGMPSMFPARSLPKVGSIDHLKSAITAEIERQSKASATASANKSEIQSASGEGGGAQAHLYRPLMRASTSLLERVMPKSPVTVLENGTVIGNTSEWNRNAEFGRNIGSLISDIIFLCPARSLAKTLSEAGRNVYFYLYTHKSSNSQYHDWLGVTHHDEVEFVFGRPLRLADAYSGSDIEMSKQIIKTWSHFAYTGQMLDQKGVKWPKYGVEDNNYMVLAADKASTGERYHDRFCNLYENIISIHLHDN